MFTVAFILSAPLSLTGSVHINDSVSAEKMCKNSRCCELEVRASCWPVVKNSFFSIMFCEFNDFSDSYILQTLLTRATPLALQLMRQSTFSAVLAVLSNENFISTGRTASQNTI